MSVSVIARRLTAAAAVAAAVVGAAVLPATAAEQQARPSRGPVSIGAVQYDSPGRDDRSNRSLNSEWVDIRNTSRRAVNLNGWRLSDRDGNTYTFRRLRLDGGSTVRVHTGQGRDTRRDVYQDRSRYIWDDNDRATLRDNRGRLVDDASWGRRFGGNDRDNRYRGNDRDNRYWGNDRDNRYRGDDRYYDGGRDRRDGDRRFDGDRDRRFDGERGPRR
ncbi:lamin tail domain-containing protein [Streptomyces sp. NPDC026672]|uniref:lamin tail domain-containing protein n=1 Tax=unclassified Streptomyces TaxID=2593676 RepID=UPI00340575B7